MTPLARGWLTLQSVTAAWLCSVVLCLLLQLELKMALWIGIFAIFTYLFFALPVVAGVPKHVQLRFWHLLMLISALWALGLLSLFFRESPIDMLITRDGGFFGYWGIGYAFAASGFYLLRLRPRRLPNRPLSIVDKVN
jgi:hypothetical protein